jgi:ATP phosphoribosyltransferase
MGEFADAKSLVGKNICTSFTNLAEVYFRELEGKKEGEKLDTHIKYVGGSVEAACALGVADGIVDLVESGETMRAAGLKAISTVLETTAILIRSKNPTNIDLVNLIATRIRGVISKTLLLHQCLRMLTSLDSRPKIRPLHIQRRAQ